MIFEHQLHSPSRPGRATTSSCSASTKRTHPTIFLDYAAQRPTPSGQGSPGRGCPPGRAADRRPDLRYPGWSATCAGSRARWIERICSAAPSTRLRRRSRSRVRNRGQRADRAAGRQLAACARHNELVVILDCRSVPGRAVAGRAGHAAPGPARPDRGDGREQRRIRSTPGNLADRRARKGDGSRGNASWTGDRRVIAAGGRAGPADGRGGTGLVVRGLVGGFRRCRRQRTSAAKG